MSLPNAQNINIIYTAVDNFSAAVTRMQATSAHFNSSIASQNRVLTQHMGALQRVGGSIEKLVAHNLKLSTSMDRLRAGSQRLNAVLQGLGIGIGIGSFYALERAFGTLARQIPDLIGKGQDWLDKIDAIMDSTGMTAETTSRWAGIVAFTGGDVERFANTLGRMGKVVTDNEEKFSRFGVATRDVNDKLLPVDGLIDSIRQRLQELGPSSTTSAALLTLLSRAGLDLSDVMQLTNPQIQAVTDRLYEMGLIATDSQVAAAEALNRTKNLLNLSITGVGTQLDIALTPILTGFIESISKAITANLQNIVSFAYQAVNFVIGLISGLFDIQIDTSPLADFTEQTNSATDAWQKAWKRAQDATAGAGATKRSSGEDQVTKSIKAQIKAIDDQIDALDRRQRQFDYEKQRSELLADINTLQQQLEDLKSKGVFTAGMTALEAELARQKQAADIVDQQREISDARQRLADFDYKHEQDLRRQALEDQKQHLNDLLRAHQDAMRKIASAASHAFDPIKAGIGKILDPKKPQSWGFQLTDAIKGAGLATMKWGKDIATSIREGIFGKDTTGYQPGFGGLGGVEGGLIGGSTFTSHTKGLIETIGDWITWAQNVIRMLEGFWAWLQINIVTPLQQILAKLFGGGTADHPFGQNLPSSGDIQTGATVALVWAVLSKIIPGLPGPLGAAGTVTGAGAAAGAAQIGGLGTIAAGGGAGGAVGLIAGLAAAAFAAIPLSAVMLHLNAIKGAGPLQELKMDPTVMQNMQRIKGPDSATWDAMLQEMLNQGLTFGEIKDKLATMGYQLGPTGVMSKTLSNSADAQYSTAGSTDDLATRVASGITVMNPSLPTIAQNSQLTATNTAGTTSAINGGVDVLNPGWGTAFTGIRSNTAPLNGGTVGIKAMSTLPVAASSETPVHVANGPWGTQFQKIPELITNTNPLADGKIGVTAQSNFPVTNTAWSSYLFTAQDKLRAIKAGFANVYWPNSVGGYSSGSYAFASGAVGLTPMGGIRAVMGEAEGEAVAILRNPRPLPASGGWQSSFGGAPIHLHIQVDSYLDKRKVAESVTEYQLRNGGRSTTTYPNA